MPNQFIRIGEETHFALDLQQDTHITSVDDYVSLCRDMYDYVKDAAGGNVDLPARALEFHYFGVSGAPGGEILAPMIWSISHFATFFSKLSNAQNALIIESPIITALAANSIPNVYTINSSSIFLLNKVRPDWQFDNLNVVPWSTARTTLPSVDFAQVVINFLVDDSLFDAILESISPGGLLIISNSSNGGELYGADGETSFPHEVHNKIKQTGNFDIMHLQGYISYTLCVRR